MTHRRAALAWLLVLASCGATSRAPVAAPLPGPYSLVEVGVGRPDAVVDLGDDASAALVSARWRHAPVSLRDVEGVEPGPDARPVPSSARTLGLSLGPRHEGWNAAAWEPFEPRDLETRRGQVNVQREVAPEPLLGGDAAGAWVEDAEGLALVAIPGLDHARGHAGHSRSIG